MLVTELGAVSENLKVTPPVVVESAGLPVPPLVYVGAKKSTVSPTAVPSASFTVIVQEMASFIRAYVVAPLVWLMHASVDAVVAEETLNENGLPLATSAKLVAIFSVTKNVVMAVGAAVK